MESHSAEHTTEISKRRSEDSITILSMPQWTWNRARCREWLRAFFIKECRVEKRIATEYAKRFQGAGAALFLLPLEKWEDLFGNELGLLVIERVEQMGRGDWES
jgi:hypothetical protein